MNAQHRPEPGWGRSDRGLPFSRKGLRPFGAAITVAAAVLALLALPGLAEGDFRDHFRAFRDGGAGMYCLLALVPLAPAALCVLGVRLMRGRRVPVLAMFGGALLARFVGAAIGFYESHKIDHVLVGIAGDMVARVAADGTSGASGPVILGELVSVACLAVLAIAAGGAIATIDVERLVSTRTRGDRLAQRGAVIAGAAWTLASLALFVAFLPGRGLTNLSVLVPVLVAGLSLVALLVARAAPALREFYDANARRHLGLGLVAAMCAVLAVVLLEHALYLRVHAHSFSSISGGSVEPLQRVRILERCLPERAYSTLALPVHMVLGLTTFAFALAPALLGGGTKVLRPPAAALAPMGLLAMLLAVFAHERTLVERRLAITRSAYDLPVAAGLPTVVSASQHSSAGTYQRYIISATGALREETPPFQEEDREESPDPPRAMSREEAEMMEWPITVFADEHLGCDALLRILAAKGVHRFGLAVIAREMVDDQLVPELDTRALGELAPFANGTSRLVSFTIDARHVGAPISARVLPSGMMSVSFQERQVIVSTAPSEHGDARRKLVDMTRGQLSNTAPFEVEYGSGCTVGELASVIATLDYAMPAPPIWTGRNTRVRRGPQ